MKRILFINENIFDNSNENMQVDFEAIFAVDVPCCFIVLVHLYLKIGLKCM